MKIIDQKNQIIKDPDLSKGWLRPDKLLIRHHEAVAGTEEESHLEPGKVYPNGGRDMVRVIDKPGQEPKDAWDEYEDVMRYTAYTMAELAKIAADKAAAEREAQRLPNLEAAVRQIMLTLAKLTGGMGNV